MDPENEIVPSQHAAVDFWDYTGFTLKGARVALVDQYNQIAGRPSLAMIVVQDEFINERMDPTETTAFARVLKGLIAAAKRND